MATVLDLGIIGNISGIFIFFLIFAGTMGLFRLFDPFKLGDQRGIYALISLCVALLAVLSKSAVLMIGFMLPWLVVLIFVGFFILFFIRMYNPGYDSGWLIGQSGVWGLLLFFVIVIFLFGLGSVFGQDLLEEQPGVITPGDRVQGDTRPVDEFVPVDEFNSDEFIEPQQEQLPPNLEQTVPDRPLATAPATGSFASNLVLTIFHPKILGMLLVLIIGALTMLLLGR